MMYVLNVDEASAAGNAHSAKAEDYARARGMPSVVISGSDRSRGGAAPAEDQAEYSVSLGLLPQETGLPPASSRAGYQLLDLVTFFTVGPGKRALGGTRRARPEAAGDPHRFRKGFIRAETIAYDDYVTLNGEVMPGDAGKLRLEGKDYPVKDGDVFHFPLQRLSDLQAVRLDPADRGGNALPVSALRPYQPPGPPGLVSRNRRHGGDRQIALVCDAIGLIQSIGRERCKPARTTWVEKPINAVNTGFLRRSAWRNRELEQESDAPIRKSKAPDSYPEHLIRNTDALTRNARRPRTRWTRA